MLYQEQTWIISKAIRKKLNRTKNYKSRYVFLFCLDGLDIFSESRPFAAVNITHLPRVTMNKELFFVTFSLSDYKDIKDFHHQRRVIFHTADD